MLNMGAWDWAIIGGIVLLLFGGKKLPELAKAIGKSITSFKQGLKGIESDITKDKDSDDKKS
ncbi:MAG: preprotein translocase [Elusimicrobia bacterium RIFCSPLOWO2_01_FULL_60_11]|nr:MAG: preprotein translocase [Elusimicrobia bacterium RIFCSPLOWO2_01_FULL_60_11]